MADVDTTIELTDEEMSIPAGWEEEEDDSYGQPTANKKITQKFS